MHAIGIARLMVRQCHIPTCDERHQYPGDSCKSSVGSNSIFLAPLAVADSAIAAAMVEQQQQQQQQQQ